MKIKKYSRSLTTTIACSLCCAFSIGLSNAVGDSVNSPNITLNVDTHRSSGAGAGNTSLAVNTITIAETQVTEYSATAGKSVSLRARPGYQFDPTSNVSALSTTIGINGTTANNAAILSPNGTANEVLTFNFTSGTSAGQDIIRINGVKIRILNAAGAVGPAQTTIGLTTSTAGGAFNDQGIVAASIQTGAPFQLAFSTQPSNTLAGADLLPVVKILDFGGNIVKNSDRSITLALLTNPGNATLLGTSTLTSVNGVATWADADDLRINTASTGYSLRATHNGAAFLSSDTADSGSFNITAGSPGQLSITTQPTNTKAGENILISVTALDSFGNPATGTSVPVTLDLSTNPTDTSLLTTSSLTKNTTNGVATWDATDELHITAAGSGYKIAASGVGNPTSSNSFNIAAADPNSVRYIQEPSDTVVDTIMNPPVQAEVIDTFGNRTDFSSTLQLSLSTAPCGGNLSGDTAIAVNGVATFDALSVDTPCNGNVLKGSAPGLSSSIAWAESKAFNVTITEVPIAIKLLELTPGKTVHFIAKGNFQIPSSAHKPTAEGGTLKITASKGKANFGLGKKGWKGLGPGRNGSKGFEFTGKNCKAIEVKPTSIEALCTLSKKSFKLPLASPVNISLDAGTSIRYCAQCGGTKQGKANKIFQRKNCAKPTTCP